MEHRFRANGWRLAFIFHFAKNGMPGQGLFDSGDQVGGEAEARAALKDVVRGHGSGCFEALPCLDSLGMILTLSGRPEEGMDFLREAHEICARRWGDNSRVTYTRLINLGICELYLGLPREALARFRQVRKAKEGMARHDPDCLLDALDAQSMEALALAEDGSEGEARVLLEDAVSALERAAPHPKRDELLEMARENLRVALELVRRDGAAPAGRRIVPGGGEPGTGNFHCSWQNLATGHEDPALEMREAGDYAGAEAKALEALALLPGQGAPGRDRALPLLDSLGWTLAYAGRLAEAFPYLEEAVSVSTRLLGHDYTATLGRRVNLGTAMILSDRYEEGLALLEEVADAGEEILGREDPGTLAARTAVGAALAKCRRYDRAVEVFRDVLAVAERLDYVDGTMVPEARDNLRLAEEFLGGLG
ncbi:MAG: tetratricopeptide repeat protein [Deltaproteobacteria bacterium]|jgi:tetratricopeptide (TPR) repeat protein|nr:tetratricopeptide repeat protein [Deltaproteobacteria bacterium]